MPFAPPELTGPNLFLQRDQLIDREAAAEVTLRICRSVTSQPDAD